MYLQCGRQYAKWVTYIVAFILQDKFYRWKQMEKDEVTYSKSPSCSVGESGAQHRQKSGSRAHTATLTSKMKQRTHNVYIKLIVNILMQFKINLILFENYKTISTEVISSWEFAF